MYDSQDSSHQQSAAAADDISIMTDDNYSRSVSSKSTTFIGTINPLSTMKKPFQRNPFRKSASHKEIDNVSVSPSLCSDVLRDPKGAMGLLSKSQTSDASMSTFDYNRRISNSSSLGDPEDLARREERKQRVREKLERDKQRQRQLKESNAALASQLVKTTEKLKEVDYKAASKIDVLEQELHETRMGMTDVVQKTQKDQTDCIKKLGKNLLRQAKIIKRQKKAIEQYTIQLDGLKEEMAMQDERDLDRDAEFQAQLEDFEKIAEQKVAMQHSLQENIEEMMDLKQEQEASAQRIMELEFDLQQKDATLARVAKETTEKSERICALEEELDEKTAEVDVIQTELKASEKSLQMAMEELEKSNEEVEDLRCKFAGWGESGATGESPTSAAEAERRRSSLFSLRAAGKSNHGVAGEAVDVSIWQEQINERDEQIRELDLTVKDHQEESLKLRSDMVKMSHTYKNDDYLKRKQIAKLKQENAEYALKLRALEKAFKAVKGDGSTNPVSSDISSSLHALNGRISKSMHSPERKSALNVSKHSTHSTHSTNSSKEERAKAAFARIGMPYKDLSAPGPILQSHPNGSSHGSEDGRKREETGER
mmetsp:Transcript_23364/g.35188  ORF Transcript_23364/g.35188 Transcript_23364/m.35188 type:complete len:597 (+) Transcript_23364:91-1881(+)